MPKRSKITGSTKLGAPPPVEALPDAFHCVRCNRSFTKRRGNFPASQSSLYRGNGGFLPVCRHCLDEIFEHYRSVLGDDRAAMRRICMKFDIYWSDKLFDQISKANTTNSRILSYISKSNLAPHTGKTYDDTLDEEAAEAAKIMTQAVFTSDSADVSDDTVAVTPDIVDFWGSGLDPAFYAELEKRYKYWCNTTNKDGGELDISERALIRQICMLEVTITRDTAAGKSIDKSINSLNTILGSANLKPIQKKEKEDLDSSMEATPFGAWIKKIEDTRPIPEPEPEFRDVDGIAKYISVWFLGHLCKMLKLDNKYSQLYEDEMARLRVDRPEYEGEDDDSIMEDIFERASKRENEELENDDA